MFKYITFISQFLYISKNININSINSFYNIGKPNNQ